MSLTFNDQSRGFGFKLGILLPWTIASIGVAQTPSIITDGTLGVPGAALSGPNLQITANLGVQKGNNLFHSFQKFDVPSQSTATFSGPDGLANILARVTGKGVSQIDGTIRSSIPGANLFLMNPNGVIFGPDASLDISGAFAATTANSIRFSDGNRFDVASGRGVQLSAASPVAFGFLGKSGDIKLAGAKLKVADGKALQLAAANVTLETGASAAATGGNVLVVAQETPGDVPLTEPGPLEIPATENGLVTLSDHSSISADTSTSGARGSVMIKAGKLTLVEDSYIPLVAGGASGPTRITAEAGGSGSAGTVQIAAHTVELKGKGNPWISAESTSDGSGGTITINAQKFSMSGEYPKSDTSIKPHLSVSVDDRKGNVDKPSGSSGKITITAKQVDISNSFIIGNSYGTGDGGHIVIDGSGEGEAVAIRKSWIESVPKNKPSINGSPTGSIEIHSANDLTIAENSHVGAGDVELSAGKAISLHSAVWIGSAALDGNAGNVSILSQDLEMSRKAQVGAYVSLSELKAENSPEEFNAGNIKISVFGDFSMGDFPDSPELSDSTMKSYVNTTVTGKGRAGTIDIKVGGRLTVGKNAEIKSEVKEVKSGGGGRAGDIVIAADSVLLENKGLISVKAPDGIAGNVTVNATEALDLVDGIIEASGMRSADRRDGGRGGISLYSPRIYLENSMLTATATAGIGGNIDIPGVDEKGAWSSEPIPNTVVLNGRTELKADSVEYSNDSGGIQDSGEIRIAALGYFKSKDANVKGTNGEETPPFGFQAPNRPPEFQLSYDSGPKWNDSSSWASSDPEGYTRVGSHLSGDRTGRRRMQLGK